MSEQDMNASWWTVTFKVGDRVIVRLSPECPHCGHDAAVLNGLTGKVLQIDDLPEYPEHLYRVALDRMAIVNGVGIFGGVTSALELEARVLASGLELEPDSP